MSKEAYYFSHDSNAKTDEKILDLRDIYGWEGYGLYWALVETLRDTTDFRFPIKSLGGLSKNFGVKREKLFKIIHEFGLFSFDENFFWSESLLKRMDAKDKKSKKSRESAIKRWENKDANAMRTHSERTANAMPIQCEPNAIKERKGKESKVKEKKEDDDCKSNPSEPEKIKCYPEFIKVYDEFILNKTNCPAKIDGMQGKAAKEIIAYLKNVGNDKSDEGIINCWKFILISWDKIEPFYQSKLKLNEINSNLINIINQIKNGFTKNKQFGANSKPKSFDELYNEYSNAATQKTA